MHYYKFNISDWGGETSHLTLKEEAILLRLVNFYLINEQPIPVNYKMVLRKLRLSDDADLVDELLVEFFEKKKNSWHMKKLDDAISDYQGKAESNRKKGKKGGRPKKDNENKDIKKANGFCSGFNDKPTGLENETQHKPNDNPNQEPRTTNQEPRTTNQEPRTTNQEPPKSEDQDLFAQNIVGEVLDYLNSRTGSKFTKLDRQSTSGMSEILQHGYTKQDMIDVINIKCDEWLTKKDFRNNLTPKILFSTRNFEGYLSQARMSAAMAESMNETEIVGAWNSLGLAQHHGITTKAKQEMQNTYTVYKDRMIKKKKEAKSIGEWAISYISGGFSNYIKRNHRENSSGWIADLEYAVRLSTYEKIINIKE